MADDTAAERGIDFAELALRIALGVGFIVLGRAKLTDNPASLWVKMFVELGAAPWFQYFTGYMQMAGGVLILWPRTADLGAAALACTMIGAVMAHLFFLDTGIGGAIFPAAILVVIAVAVWKRRNPPPQTAPVTLR